jgi:hypothetical protein
LNELLFATYFINFLLKYKKPACIYKQVFVIICYPLPPRPPPPADDLPPPIEPPPPDDLPPPKSELLGVEIDLGESLLGESFLGVYIFGPELWFLGVPVFVLVLGCVTITLGVVV